MTAMSSRPADSAAHKRTLEVLSGGAARFSGCSSIRHYNVQEKLGEGTFGSAAALFLPRLFSKSW